MQQIGEIDNQFPHPTLKLLSALLTFFGTLIVSATQ